MCTASGLTRSTDVRRRRVARPAEEQGGGRWMQAPRPYLVNGAGGLGSGVGALSDRPPSAPPR